MQPTHDHPKRFSSALGFILAATGAAVGLGNIWKFPYMVGNYGGSAFVLVYLICVFLIGMPVMAAEIMVGRSARKNPVSSLTDLAMAAGQSPRWGWLGWWGLVNLLVVLSFYSVVSGWSLAYIYYAFSGALNPLSVSACADFWAHFLSNPGLLLLCHTLFMLMTCWVVAQGVRHGLERAVRWMMPGLFVLLMVLVAYGYTTSGFHQAWDYLFAFQWHKITLPVVVNAMGHALFSLAVGAGCLLVYGAYLPENTSIGYTVTVTTFLNLLVAILSGLAIFPWVFTHHLLPQAGPGLMFQVLPVAFSSMHYGQWIGGLFFILLLFAAWTSSISLLEPLVVMVIERHRLSRMQANGLMGFLAWLLGLCSLLSFNLWSNHQTGHTGPIFEALTDLSTNVMLPIGSLGFALFVGWVLPSKQVCHALGIQHPFWCGLWSLFIRIITPLGIVIVLWCAWV